MKYRILDRRDWQGLVDRERYPSPFHEYDWQLAIGRFYYSKPEMLHVTEGECGWLFPLYKDLPWLDKQELKLGSIGYGGPLAIHEFSDPLEEIRKITEMLHRLAIQYKANRISSSLYPSMIWKNKALASSIDIDNTVKISLTGDINKTFTNILSGNVRTAIRKAESNKVKVTRITLSDHDAFNNAIDLLQATQKQVNSTYITDKQLLNALMSLDSNDIEPKLFIAELDGKIVSMAFAIHNQYEFFHLFHGWDRSASGSAANQALIWEMIKYAEQRKISLFNMGSSHTDSLLEAKLRYGGRVEPVPQLRVVA